jgi:hypothetical protein
MPQACMDCVAAAGHDMDALAACQPPYADCNALQLPTDRADWLDLHLARQR